MREVDLLNKKVLYIGPASFHYDKYIIKKLTSLGAVVADYDVTYLHPTTLAFKIINKINHGYQKKIKKVFYDRVLQKGNYDYVLVRHSFDIDENFLAELRKVNINARFIFFHWDSLRPEYNYLHLIKYFDKVFSFDVKDCQEHEEINYLPLFYLDIYETFRKNNLNNTTEKKYDVLFIGAWRNTERLNLINLTEGLCKRGRLRFYHYLYFPVSRQISAIRRGVIPKKARAKQLSHTEILDLFAVTNAVIDFPSSFQTGLTIRTFEALGAGKKLITTNKNIINEPFYDPEYISIIDINNFTLDAGFIKNTPVSSLESKIKDYSIGNYLNKLFQ